MKIKELILVMILIFLASFGVSFALNITVPSAPSSGYWLTSTSTGAYISTTTSPILVGSVNATTTTATSTFSGGLNLGNYFSFAPQGYFDILTTTAPPAPALGIRIYGQTANGTDSLNRIDSTGFLSRFFLDSFVQVRNTTGSTLTKGQVVYINGATGNVPTVALAQSSTSFVTSRTIGVVAETITNNGFGRVQTAGKMNNIDTSAFANGDIIYLGTSVGSFQNTEPAYPNLDTVLGYVTNSGVGNGSIYVRITERHRDEDGEITNNFQTGDTSAGVKTHSFMGTQTGTLNYDSTNNKFYFGDSPKIGIGTTSPYTALSVVGETVGSNFTATSTTAVSTFAGKVGIATTSPAALLDFGPGTATTGQMHFASSTLKTTPVAGDMEYSGGHWFVTNGARHAISTSAGIATTSTTVSNTTATSTLYSYTFAPNELHQDEQVTFDISGFYSNASASDDFTMSFAANGVTFHTITRTGGNQTNVGWQTIFHGTIRSQGASGTFVDFAKLLDNEKTYTTADSAPHSIDTTASFTFTANIKWGAAKAGNTLTSTQGSLQFAH